MTASRRRRPEAWYRLTVGAGRLGLAALRVDAAFEGLERIPRRGPVLLAATHGSYLDFAALAWAGWQRGRFVRFLTRADVWDRRGIGYAMDRMGHVPVDRQAPAAAYLRARRLLQAGEAVGTFPEAGISHSFAVRALMRGTAALARDTGAPIVPVALWGWQRIYTVGRRVAGRSPGPDWTRGRAVDVVVGEPFRVPAGADVTEATRRLGEVLTVMLEDLQTRPRHAPSGSEDPWHPAHLGGGAPDRRQALGMDHLPVGALTPTWGPPLPPAPDTPVLGDPAPPS